MFNTIVRAGAVGAGAASRYGSDQMMRLRNTAFSMHIDNNCNQRKPLVKKVLTLMLTFLFVF
jgi:hypothetical protein